MWRLSSILARVSPDRLFLLERYCFRRECSVESQVGHHDDRVPERAQALQKASELTATRGYQISRKLRHRIEHLLGEAKQSHGLGRARFRGLAKMKEQATLTATVQNLKRLVNFLGNPGRRVPNQATMLQITDETPATAELAAFRADGDRYLETASMLIWLRSRVATMAPNNATHNTNNLKKGSAQ